MAPSHSKPRLEEYRIACICPLYLEAAPLEALLNEVYSSTARSDTNSYTLGRIGEHNNVIATMPGTGTNKAALVAPQLLSDFKAIKYWFLVGIGGGVPSEEDDIRLGDIVVGLSKGSLSGVVEFKGERFIQRGSH
ncbi:hypothetical protein BDW59DRAFT_166960 [Aspergillus cavernicola]|uniref:Nucleoside phosphorylase domain-containing protein n=1 Tax=Aspergillus cavernicola TaxID=176166 RepID=A0ABR4HHV5_9EURO